VALRHRLPTPVISLADRALALRAYDAGTPSAPPHRARRRQLLRLVRERGHSVFVESGTYLGDTVAFLAPHVSEIRSIEIEPLLYSRAARRFAEDPKVTIVQGDAMVHLPRILSEVSSPPLVFLDGHFSGGVTGKGDLTEPAVRIVEELGHLTLPPGTTIVVDDVRLFGADPEFPSFDELLREVQAAFPDAARAVELDALIVRL
jgi:predicted O-methyltransferase YrrM